VFCIKNGHRDSSQEDRGRGGVRRCVRYRWTSSSVLIQYIIEAYILNIGTHSQ